MPRLQTLLAHISIKLSVRRTTRVVNLLHLAGSWCVSNLNSHQRRPSGPTGRGRQSLPKRLRSQSASGSPNHAVTVRAGAFISFDSRGRVISAYEALDTSMQCNQAASEGGVRH